MSSREARLAEMLTLGQRFRIVTAAGYPERGSGSAEQMPTPPVIPSALEPQ